jgi:uncharacterized membrane protein
MKKKSIKKIAKNLLGGTLAFAGFSHLTFARKAFQAQVPNWVPLKKENTVVYSGIAEIVLGSALVMSGEEHREMIGKLTAAFFISVFPGNLSQYINQRDAFGLDTDGKRLIRLFLQAGLVYWALKSTEKEEQEENYLNL